jgi:hypothetical protein
MCDAKSYVIGIIEIDPVSECQQAWVTLAGDDDTLEAVLARLAGRVTCQETAAGPDSGHGLPGGSSIDESLMAGTGRHKPAARKTSQASAAPEHVAANLAELSADLAVCMAEIRGRLAAAGPA